MCLNTSLIRFLRVKSNLFFFGNIFLEKIGRISSSLYDWSTSDLILVACSFNINLSSL